ncbi:MAG: DinB family protein [Chitinophagaceae bacterium]
MLKQQLNIVLQQLCTALYQISDDDYRYPAIQLEGNSIGAHTRHIIELYQELLRGYENGVVDYDQRKRDQQIQTERNAAINRLIQLIQAPTLENKPIVVLAPSMQAGEHAQPIGSTYDRELMYHIEHAIHHLALIRVAFQELAIGPLPENFGVAPSTMAHRMTHR